MFLSLGSNIEPAANLARAVRMLGEHGRIVGVSRVRETAPVGFADQPNFLNAAVLLESKAALEAWLEEIIPDIERRLGRTRDPHNPNGPRTIDVDVALCGDECRTIGRRRVPDPDILTRPFLAAALAELDSQRRHPETGRTLGEIAAALDAANAQLRFRPDVELLP